MKFIYKMIMLICINITSLVYNAYSSYDANLVCEFSPQTIQFEDNHYSYKVQMNTWEFIKKWQINKFTKRDGVQISWQDDNNWEKYKIIPIPEGIYCFDIKKNQNIEYYLDLLLILINNDKTLNEMIKDGFYDNETNLKLDNFMSQFEAKLLFQALFLNVSKSMRRSQLLQKYELNQIIRKFSNNYINCNDNNEKINRIWRKFNKELNTKIYLKKSQNKSNQDTNEAMSKNQFNVTICRRIQPYTSHLYNNYIYYCIGIFGIVLIIDLLQYYYSSLFYYK